MLRFAVAAFEKAKQHRAALAVLWDDLLALVRLVTAWSKGEYTAIPWRSIIMATGALVYFLNPLDAIPDAIPAFGYIDDASVVALIAKALKADIERFVRWDQARDEWLRTPKAQRLPRTAPTRG